jgi:hypothetical protein
MGLLVENNPHYDAILDLYNEVGIQGMSNDEVDYLKSGGQTELPQRFKNQINQEKYDDFQTSGGISSEKIRSEDWGDIYVLNNIIEKNNGRVEVRDDYNGVGFFLGYFCNLVFEYDKGILNLLKKLNNQSLLDTSNLRIENDKIVYTIPKSWLKYLDTDGDLSF